jgi:hypothetical protein
MCFTHFISVDYAVTVNTLEVVYERGAAVSCPARHPAVDLIIPVKLKTGRMSFILIQVKNWSEKYVKNDAQKILANINPVDALLVSKISDIGGPYMAFYMQLGSQTPEVVPEDIPPSALQLRDTLQRQNVAFHRKNRISLAVFGISAEMYPCLSDNDVLQTFRLLVDAQRSRIGFEARGLMPCVFNSEDRLATAAVEPCSLGDESPSQSPERKRRKAE